MYLSFKFWSLLKVLVQVTFGGMQAEARDLVSHDVFIKKSLNLSVQFLCSLHYKQTVIKLTFLNFHSVKHT